MDKKNNECTFTQIFFAQVFHPSVVALVNASTKFDT